MQSTARAAVLVLGPVIALAAVALGLRGSDSKNSRKYWNERYNFCIEYPRDWARKESFTRNGVGLQPKKPSGLSAVPNIAIGARVNQPSEADQERLRTLEEDFQFMLESLQEQEEDVAVLSKEKGLLQGLPAITSTIYFIDRRSRRPTFVKDVILKTDYERIYFLSLECHPDDAPSVVPILDKIVESFKLHCRPNKPDF